jgi:hypothetical protein
VGLNADYVISLKAQYPWVTTGQRHADAGSGTAAVRSTRGIALNGRSDNQPAVIQTETHSRSAGTNRNIFLRATPLRCSCLIDVIISAYAANRD